MIVLKSGRELELMRRAGEIVARTIRVLQAQIQPRITTGELDRIAEETIRSLGGLPAFKGYQGFPASICVSIDDEVVHGIPGGRKLQAGELVSIDVGVAYRGYNGDSAFTVAVGSASAEARRLMAVTRDSLAAGIEAARPGMRLGDISASVQRYVEEHGFNVIRDYVGHGIGQAMHEPPQVPNFGDPGTGPLLEAGMTLAIEPMVVTGGYGVTVDSNGWTVRTADGGLAAHFEHTIAITEDGPRVLTAGGWEEA